MVSASIMAPNSIPASQVNPHPTVSSGGGGGPILIQSRHLRHPKHITFHQLIIIQNITLELGHSGMPTHVPWSSLACWNKPSQAPVQREVTVHIVISSNTIINLDVHDLMKEQLHFIIITPPKKRLNPITPLFLLSCDIEL